MNAKDTLNLIIRYVILIALAFNSLYLIYLIFTPLTVYPVFWVLKWLYGAQLLFGNQIFFKGYYAELANACIAGAAYYLLLILNLTTPMHILKRIKSLSFIILSFLFLNILRIIIFSILMKKGYSYFDIAHIWTWYLGGTLLVILVWFANVYLFKIKAIPIYSDLQNIFKDILKK